MFSFIILILPIFLTVQTAEPPPVFVSFNCFSDLWEDKVV
ncbi:hypothetical protein HMPREF1548_00037 [Clostridium sp. KLE 1755]|nr:hypothetical protein HMPREF1548_00037 [Clostridium sp. KLE 1755]